VRWARDLAIPLPHSADLRIADPAALEPLPTPGALVQAAAAAPDMQAYLAALGHRHPFYDALADELARLPARDPADPRTAALRASLERARLLPTARVGRHILVDAASARLWMFEDGRIVGRMKVIVGKPGSETPLAAGMIRHAIANPYWNVPMDLGQTRVAKAVLENGLAHLEREHLQTMSDWTDAAVPIDPATVDWTAVAAGRAEVRVRQLPGRGNMMGAMKFPFDNPLGIYLHDTPDKAAFRETSRQLSAGCVRLSSWKRLAQWLGVPGGSGAPEEQLDLPAPVPVYISYLTVDPERPTRAVADVYRRDAAVRLAGGGS
jgi:murein L,D-transpeptidase YcbB/YkuD